MLEYISNQAVVGTPLEESKGLDGDAIERLHALSIASVEELLGVIAADPEAVSSFLEGTDLAKFQADVGPRAAASIYSELKDFEGRDYATGAAAPEGVDVEHHASNQTFERHAAEPAAAGADIGTGVHLTDCLGPVRHQGNRGTCVAHAVCAVMECLSFKSTSALLDLSEQFMYWNCKQHDGEPNAEGTLIAIGMTLAGSDGACLEATWQYNPEPVAGNEAQGPPPDAAAPEAAQHLVGPPSILNKESSTDIRSALDRGKPVAFSIPRYNNWTGNPFVDATGRIPMPVPSSKFTGGHAMCAVGYQADPTSAGGGYLIVRNSWGAGWASLNPSGPGHAHVPFAYVDTYGWEAATAG